MLVEHAMNTLLIVRKTPHETVHVFTKALEKGESTKNILFRMSSLPQLYVEIGHDNTFGQCQNSLTIMS